MKKVLIVNPILYTNEQKKVRKIKSIKDCMIVDLCNAFVDMGYDTTLVAAEDYKPIDDEQYKFNIVWLRSYFKQILTANKIPCNLELKRYLKNNEYDLIISSEVFSIDTLLCVMNGKDNLIIWQEMAFHQHLAKQMASKIWHNIIVKSFYKNVRIIARSENAKGFISKYSDNVSDTIIQHGIDLDKFSSKIQKNNSFVICSQLIERKRIGLSIEAFGNFIKRGHEDYILHIIGDGDQKEKLVELTRKLKISDSVIFNGKMCHDNLIDILSDAKAMLIYTEKDNSMISIAESIAVGTPVITTSVPDNAISIKKNQLGIVADNWGWKELEEIVSNPNYISNCAKYRSQLDNRHNVELFMKEIGV